MAFDLHAIAPADWPAVEQLLTQSSLPLAGAAAHRTQFLGAWEDGRLIGCGGLEAYGDAALLRSLAVDRGAAGRGVGSALTQALLDQATANGHVQVYLLTVTAEDFFPRLGFSPCLRANVPAAVQTSAEFQGACPASAAVLVRNVSSGARIRPANEADMPGILAIYNDAVAHTTASYDYEPRTMEKQLALWQERVHEGFPFYVAALQTGEVAGYASYGYYRPRAGWRFACEHSVYVASGQRRRGIAALLMPPLLHHAKQRGFHTMVGVIDAANAASVALHQRFGFETFGIMKEGGYKFDRWLDVAFMQRML